MTLEEKLEELATRWLDLKIAGKSTDEVDKEIAEIRNRTKETLWSKQI